MIFGCLRSLINRNVDVSVAAQAIGFAGKSCVLDGNALLALGIEFTRQQFALQFLDDAK